MQADTPKKELRSFGLIVGGIFVLLGAWPVVVHRVDPRWWSVLVGGVLLISAIVYPKSLFWVHKGWMLLGHVLGWVNTRVILSVVFFIVITPIGVLRRILGKDPMGRRIEPGLNSYRVIRKARPSSHLRKQY